MRPVLIVLVVIVGLLLLFGIGLIVSHNRFVRQCNLISEPWRQVDVELARRHDLIPTLVETIKSWTSMSHHSMWNAT